ncbi:NADH dehydrogenase FAD-containing subunit [Halogeometricum borinquense]|uniref:NADH dehydrogenase FAD-containing subunit n=1 Tax=Halogeometricum borinquense TaxID=60847 RepID=A0A6C0UDN5_9EURY|nr:NADH-ubiquinone oxidoreductase-F iron-sulfur binding region domain-containing protein [Halogeometricum borinquense]QIB73257.1 NADH dehydrogenase FAD-containing subunit [Halogeometricum borinquense]QIQ77348.1 NADH dehydrogenase FAD-containing subunit [Halogeometricum borinquense]
MTTSNEAVGGPVVRVAGGSSHRTDVSAVVDAAKEATETATVRETGPTGADALEPLLLVTMANKTAFYATPSLDTVRNVIHAAESGKSVDALADGADAIVESDGTRLPVPDEGPLRVGRRRVLGRCGWVDPTEPPTESVLDAVSDDPESVRAEIHRIGLLGRGRGDARADRPVAEGWATARKADGDTVLVVNANDADERNRTDSTLVEGDAGGVVDAAMAVAHLVEAADVIMYAQMGSMAAERLSAAASRYRDAYGDAPQVAVGPERYIAGEPTMALESLEGNDRLEARLRPPGPETHGLYGRPTVIHTPRTLLQVREAILRPEEFDADDADPGTRVVTVTGDVDSPATVELTTGAPLRAAAAAVDRTETKMAIVGGQFGGVTRHLDHTLSAPALSGSNLGTEGVIELFGDDRCALATVGSRARFASEENCGRCVPCREGTTQLTDLLRDIYAGDYDDDMLRELTRTMQNTSTCDFGRSAARTVETAMAAFEAEFEAHTHGRCPTGQCDAQAGQ